MNEMLPCIGENTDISNGRVHAQPSMNVGFRIPAAFLIHFGFEEEPNKSVFDCLSVLQVKLVSITHTIIKTPYFYFRSSPAYYSYFPAGESFFVYPHHQEIPSAKGIKTPGQLLC
jgi:hypothetical protein